MRHKHADMIIAKAENMGLIVLVRLCGEWVESNYDGLVSLGKSEFFLCLTQHKKPCLHWLNGGSVQDYFEDEWDACSDYDGNNNWSYEHMFMLEEAEYRIAPKKEKRWIAVNSDGYVMPVHCGSKESAIEHAKHCNRLIIETQFIEIEIEIEMEV